MDTLGDDLGVLVGSIFRGLGGSSLECQSMSLVLHALRCDKSLDLGGFGVWLAAALGCNFSSNDELSAQLLEMTFIFSILVNHTGHHPACSNQRTFGSW